MLSDLPLPAVVRPPASLRRGRPEDLAALVGLLADDPISAARGDVAADADLATYAGALEEVLGAEGNDLVVTEVEGEVVGTMQLTRIPGMARVGAARLLVEAVRVRADRRSAGIGGAMLRWVLRDAAPALGAELVQLTSDASRSDAHRFYEGLGFVASHVGFKYRTAVRG